MNGRGLRTGELAERAGAAIRAAGVLRGCGRAAADHQGRPAPRFTLAEIEELLDLSEHRRGTGELHRRAGAKVAEVDAKIAQLTRVRQALLAVLDADCDSLTDCSCGLARSLPDLAVTGPGGAGGLA